MTNDSSSPLETGERGSECEHEWRAIASEVVGSDELEVDDDIFVPFNFHKTTARCVHCGELQFILSSYPD